MGLHTMLISRDRRNQTRGSNGKSEACVAEKKKIFVGLMGMKRVEDPELDAAQKYLNGKEFKYTGSSGYRGGIVRVDAESADKRVALTIIIPKPIVKALRRSADEKTDSC